MQIIKRKKDEKCFCSVCFIVLGAIIGGGIHRIDLDDKKCGLIQIALFWIGKITVGIGIGKVLLLYGAFGGWLILLLRLIWLKKQTQID